MPHPEGVEEREAAAGLLDLAARLFLQELDVAAAQGLRTHGVVELLERLQPGVGERLQGVAEDPGTADDVAAEFCRLFLMKQGTSPMASVWTGGDNVKSGEVWTERVLGWEAALGVAADGGVWGNLPKDHLAGLLALWAAALRRGDDRISGEIGAALRPWVPGFCGAVQDASEEPVYRAAAALVTQLLPGIS